MGATRYYAETDMGATLIVAGSVESAHKKARERVGSYNRVHLVRKATAQDIAWVSAMGGVVPDTRSPR